MVLRMIVDRRMMYLALSTAGRECWTESSFCLIFCRIFGSPVAFYQVVVGSKRL